MPYIYEIISNSSLNQVNPTNLVSPARTKVQRFAMLQTNKYSTYT